MSLNEAQVGTGARGFRFMLIKFIVCNVPQENRERFSRGQQRWSALNGASGFRGQVGGWNNNAEAVIVGIWQGDDAYAHFMQELHDPIFDASEQKGSYNAGSVSLWDSLFVIPGSMPTIPAAIEDSRLIRIARCELLPGRRDQFIEMQRSIWNPGMGGCAGMLAGAFSKIARMRASSWSARCGGRSRSTKHTWMARSPS